PIARNVTQNNQSVEPTPTIANYDSCFGFARQVSASGDADYAQIQQLANSYYPVLFDDNAFSNHLPQPNSTYPGSFAVKREPEMQDINLDPLDMDCDDDEDSYSLHEDSAMSMLDLDNIF